ncbi:MAG: D-alanyl-D-alanine carboxypeptidase family protein [Oscillospiraceae bacterium]
MKKILISLLLAALLSGGVGAIETLEENAISISAPSALLMEKETGTIIYAKHEHDKGSPASVTKIMTLLLVMEELDGGRLAETDMISCSTRASSMGGSQIWLKEGETMSVHDMLKAVTVVSANDCAVALAEHISGSEESFVAKMNARALELGMKDSYFVDCTGLTEDPNHLTSAYDVALMSRELIKHDKIKEFTTIWMDSLRDGKSALTNTNKLVRFYKGTTGLKTGFTSRAMHCLSATAQRDGTEYIAVVLHAPSSNERFECAKTLLNYAFANYALCPLRSPTPLPPVMVELGTADSVQPIYGGESAMLLEKTKLGEARYELKLPEKLSAPIGAGEVLGEMLVYSGDNELARVPLLAGSEVAKLSLFQIYGRMLSRLYGG